MPTEFYLLMLSAIVISCLHTAAGPDHYLPFIALARSRGWSVGRTLFWVVVCGCGHVWSSVLLALVGALLGWSLSLLTWFEGVRGSVAGWALLLFGAAYSFWGLVRTRLNRRHRHFDVYEDGTLYVYEHKEGAVVDPRERHVVTPWVLFLVFVLGPCEPMIPLLYLPAVQSSWWGMVVLVLVYTFFTLLTMILIVLAGYYGSSLLKTDWLERHMHTLSGLTVFICGAGMVFMGW